MITQEQIFLYQFKNEFELDRVEEYILPSLHKAYIILANQGVTVSYQVHVDIHLLMNIDILKKEVNNAYQFLNKEINKGEYYVY